MNLADLLNIDHLHEQIKARYINAIRSPDGRHTIYDYTDKATYDRVWTPETTVCRGLVVENDTDDIVARGFDKFHNLDEPGAADASTEAVAARGSDFEVWSKLDGSMVLLWWDGRTWRTSTRARFDSAQAVAAREWITHTVNSWDLDPTYCYIGEWVGPGNRIVVNYPEDQWVLTGVRSLETGAEATNGQLHTWAERLKVSPCPFWIVRSGLDELIAAQATWTGIEGWVLRWSDGFRVKVKTSEYLDLHRLIMDLTPKRIHEALIAGTYLTYLNQLPEEHRALAESYADDITIAAGSRRSQAYAVFAELEPLLAESRKAFALEASKHPDVRVYLFMLADGKPIDAAILRDCAPSASAVPEPA